jgi:hypothetical protein
MKRSPLPLAGAVLVACAACAGPLQKEQVAADAKWVIHVDVDNFKETQLGQFIGDEILERHLAKPRRELERQFNLRFDWRQVHSLTAYGAEFNGRSGANGVLLIYSSFDFAEALDQVRDKLAAQLAGADPPLRKIEGEAGPLYSLKDEVFGAALPGKLFVISKSKNDLEKARQVVSGKAANLASMKTFTTYPDAPKAFFILGVAEAFTQAPLPPQAKVLKSAEGGRVIMGEKDENCFVNLALNAKDREAAAQIQQVAQGLVALAALSQTEDKDLQQLQVLAKGTKINTNDKLVTIDLEMPIKNVIARLAAAHKKRDRRSER